MTPETAEETIPTLADGGTEMAPETDGDREALMGILDALPSSREADDEDMASASETNGETPEPGDAAPADGGEPGGDEEPFAGLEQLAPEEKAALWQFLKAAMAGNGQPVEAPIQPSEETRAAAEAAQAQQQALLQQQQAAWQPYYGPLTDDDLIDPDRVNAHLQARDAALESRLHQRQVETLAPWAGYLLHMGVATLLIERENPALKGQTETISTVVAKLMEQDPGLDINSLVESGAQQMLKNASAARAIEKLAKSGKPIDGRRGTPPAGLPRSGVERNPVNGQFTGKQREISPLAEAMYRMGLRSGQIK